MENVKYETIDEYILAQPKEYQAKLTQLRSIINATAPKATEKISWGMPTFQQNGNLVHFALHKKHIGFYPAPSGVNFITAKTDKYVSTKGGVQLPLDEELPEELIKTTIAFRLKEQVGE